MGRTRDAAPGTPPDRPVQRLLAAGLLRRIDDDTVILPRDVGQVLRGEAARPHRAVRPGPGGQHHHRADVDASAAGAVLELIREVEVVLETLSAAPVPELRSGGLGVREAKRLGKLTGIDEQRLGLVLELAAAAGLIVQRRPGPRRRRTTRVATGRRRWPPTGSWRRRRRALAAAGHHLAGPAVPARA